MSDPLLVQTTLPTNVDRVVRVVEQFTDAPYLVGMVVRITEITYVY